MKPDTPTSPTTATAGSIPVCCPLTDADRFREWLVSIVEVYDMRADLFTNDADCARSLADRAKAALSGRIATDAF